MRDSSASLRAVIFDLDGTLIDWGQSRDEKRRALFIREVLQGMLQTLERAGLSPPPLEEVVGEYSARMTRGWEGELFDLRPPHLGEILEATLAATGMDGERPDRQTLLQAFPWKAAPGVTSFPDAPGALRTLLDQGIKTGLVTNSSHPMWLRDRELEAFGLLHLLPHCRLSAADVGRLKPHPQIFRAALARLGVGPHEAVFVGDNPVADISGAQNAGMRAVLRRGRNDTAELARLIEPDHRLDTLEELPAVLDDWYPGWR
ncbi:MAG: HAD family hydrolase [Anaerolineaceae bacterium]|nr:HAD family hydrolase [Anaerolineaceae bacterium]